MLNRIMEECPSFSGCSAPKCPLDEDFNLRISLPGEEKCKAFRSVRVKIAKKYPEIKLVCKGLTPKEAAGQRQRDRLRELVLNQSNK